MNQSLGIFVRFCPYFFRNRSKMYGQPVLLEFSFSTDHEAMYASLANGLILASQIMLY